MPYRLPPRPRQDSASRSPDGPSHPRRRKARQTVQALPTLCTLGNLLCGFLAIFFGTRPPDTILVSHYSPFTIGAAFIFLGMVFDAIDGWVARRTHSTSDLGLELDSMADMVTFGVAPALIVVCLIGIQTPFLGPKTDFYFDRTVLVIACIYAACAALRLARFNVEVKSPALDDHLHFKGLPSPGAAGTVASLVLLHQHFLVQYTDANHWSIRAAAIVMVAVMLLTAIAMVSRLRYVHLFNRFVRGRVRFSSLVRVVVVGLLLWIFDLRAVAALMVFYALSAPAVWVWQRLTGRRAQASPAASGVTPAPGLAASASLPSPPAALPSVPPADESHGPQRDVG